jgi:hypothetical protein
MLAGALAILRLIGPSAVIEDARRRSKALRVGMSEAEVEATLARPPAHKGQLYGYWMEDRGWYATREPRFGPSTEPGAKLYDYRQWNLGHRGSSGFEDFCVCALLDKGCVVCFWSIEDRENMAERWLKRAGGRLSLDTTILSHRRYGPSQASKPSQ